ncbi:TIGR03618 family F420-dependent PPOX class oxidoreductase [Pseudonocardia xinjiangensis]|uniref:TIGR03618 family F420-dependent PPOX class oxidoreductase n=1 Tax=Pseudonocardia xinjiangensis TaxID=75289 RepID=A0ABX1RSG6_9PSEU|nr:TIGR03618 family F420-dependent PPOX class oxidoreductase [Pseudonocardia xinjiangensis]NMH82025.1 TIGR03618 family F420-dependent PPOX class oxidoreductase [Pseudonocardia xinjiangensis]
MKRIVITSGTDGMGKALALDRLGRGDEVVIVGRDADKGAAVLDLAARSGAAGRGHVVQADLSLVAGTRAAIEEIRSLVPSVDALVLGARHHRSRRAVTAEGVESTFALFYLSRFVTSHEMTDLFDAADAPVVVNVAGPSTDPGTLRWHDLEFEHGYDGTAAQVQGGLLNDLLAVGYADHPPSRKVRYVLLHPGMVSTSFSGEYDPPTAAQVDALRATAMPVDKGIEPIIALLDDTPAEPVSAWMRNEPIPLTGPAFDVAAARRLRAATARLLAELPRTGRRPYVMSGVSPERLQEVLDSPIFATVATVAPDGTPQQSVVWVERDGDDVLFMVGVGSRKARNLHRDPRVSVLVCPPEAPYSYAAIRGTAVFEPASTERLRDDLSIKYVGRTYAEHVERTPEAKAGHGEVVAVRVRPERIAGRL